MKSRQFLLEVILSNKILNRKRTEIVMNVYVIVMNSRAKNHAVVMPNANVDATVTALISGSCRTKM